MEEWGKLDAFPVTHTRTSAWTATCARCGEEGRDSLCQRDGWCYCCLAGTLEVTFRRVSAVEELCREELAMDACYPMPGKPPTRVDARQILALLGVPWR